MQAIKHRLNEHDPNKYKYKLKMRHYQSGRETFRSKSPELNDIVQLQEQRGLVR